MLVHRLGHRRLFAAQLSVLAAHDALQLGELAHHAGHEVGLGEMGAALGRGQLGFRQAGRLGDLGRQLLEADRLVVHRPQAFLEDDRLQLLHPVGQSHLLIFLEEEAGVGQAGFQHPLVAVADDVDVVLAAVADGDEHRQQAAVGGEHGEIALMLAHRRDDRLGRQGEVHVLEPPAQRGRIFHEEDDFLQQVLVDDRRAPLLDGQFLHLLADDSAAEILVDHHVVVGHLHEIVLGRGQLNRPLAEEAVAVALVAGRDLGERERHDIAAEQRHQPTDGAGEPQVEVAPTHALGEGQGVDDLR